MLLSEGGAAPATAALHLVAPEALDETFTCLLLPSLYPRVRTLALPVPPSLSSSVIYHMSYFVMSPMSFTIFTICFTLLAAGWPVLPTAARGA